MDQRAWDPAQLGVQSGVPYHTVRTYVEKERSPGSVNAARMAKALGCSVDYLMGLTDDPSPRVVDGKTDEERALLAIAKRLTPLRQAELLRQARAVEESQAAAGLLTMHTLDQYDKAAANSTEAERVERLYAVLNGLSRLVEGISGVELMSMLGSITDASGEQGGE